MSRSKFSVLIKVHNDGMGEGGVSDDVTGFLQLSMSAKRAWTGVAINVHVYILLLVFFFFFFFFLLFFCQSLPLFVDNTKY